MPRHRRIAFGLTSVTVLAVAVGILAVLSRSASDAGAAHARMADDKPIKALLVIGGCCHDYLAQGKLITEGISARANVEWTVAYDPDKGTKHLNPVYEKEDWYKGFDVIVHD